MSGIERKPHCLIREKSLAMPRHIIFFDTETKQTELPNGKTRQDLKLGWACYLRKRYGRHIERTEWLRFRDCVTFWNFVFARLQKKTKIWLIARNIVFDFTILKGWLHLYGAGFKLKFFHNSGLTTIITVRNKEGTIVFLDSMNWFVESLAKTGERIGLPKLDIDFATCTIKQLSKYCHRDVEIELENFKRFMSFLESGGISRLCYTQASTAFAAYLFGYYDTKIYIHNNKEATDLERESYKGGRTECFYIGALNHESYYILDVNSLYPAVMHDNLYPYKYHKIVAGLRQDSLKEVLGSKAVISRVLIDTDEPAYAVKHDRTIFPTGRFWTVLTTLELKYALSRGHIKEIRKTVFYEQADLFSRYVKRIYALRLKFKAEGNAEYAEFCKKLLNTLYGKFGQKADVWEKIGTCSGERDRVELCFKSGENKRSAIRYLLGEVFELVGWSECFNSFPAIAAHVTAYARMYLYELMKQAGVGNYYYCDTDSLIVNEVGLCNLQNRTDSVKLGSMKVVQTTHNLIIRGLKDYSIDGRDVIKGIRKNAVKKADNVYEQERWPSFKGLLRSDDVNVYTVKRQQKVLKRDYTKGIVERNGIVTPFCLDGSCPLFPQRH